jgi:hypothetical protein
VKRRGRADELSKLQEELRSLAGARRAGEVGRVNHLQLERLLSCSSTSRNGGIGRPRSFRVLATRAFGGPRPRPSLRETVPVPEMYPKWDSTRCYRVQVAFRFQNRTCSEFQSYSRMAFLFDRLSEVCCSRRHTLKPSVP